MSGQERYNILIVDPDSESRGRLKQVALSLTTFNKVFTVTTIPSALGKTDSIDLIDIVIISHRFGEADIVKFIEQAKKTKRGAEWAYMAVLKCASQKSEVIASGVMGGIDGFLFEPYSANNMREMALICSQVKARNELGRKRAALTMLLQEIWKHLDAVALYRASGREASPAERKLKEGCANLKQYGEDIFEIYVEAAIEVFGAAEPPKGRTYCGISTRVKAKLEALALKKLEQKYQQTAHMR